MLSMHPEYLNTPRLVADSAGTTVWRWDQQEPFGNNPADDDPDGNSVAFDLPLRLPGQRYDQETGLHYNYFRDYDPSIGRYGESDPIGLAGGINTYAYVAGDPLGRFDRLGLVTQGGADYLGGLAGKGAKSLADKIIEQFGQPAAAGQDAAAELCALFQGRRPPDLFSECTDKCTSRLDKLRALSKVASSWLVKCIESCEETFPKCNNKKTSCPTLGTSNNL